ncbi:MAG TPA: NUDIX domain-containing protein [Rubrobacter sp.]|nr:NUDIX domain-containing protein [Rubrobacter sp.]
MPDTSKAKFFYRSTDTPRPNRPIGVGVLALIERDGALLLERRSDCGRWGLIGGGVDVEESLEDALRREVREETGLVVASQELYGVLSDPSRIVSYPDGNVVRLVAFVFRTEVEGFETLRRSDESEELRFFGPEELPDLDVIETARPILDSYLSADFRRSILLD